MKKILIPVAAALIVCGTLAGFMYSGGNNQPAHVTPSSYANGAVVKPEAIHQPEEFHPSFAAVQVPENMKQHYTLNPKAAQVITGNSGTMILVPGNAFTDRSGNAVKGKVKLELVEGIVREDILTMNLGTMSDQGILETGGMIYVTATTEGGDTLELAEGKSLDVEISAVNVKEGMQVWEGQENADGSITWINPAPINSGLREVPLETLVDLDSAAGTPAIPKVVLLDNDLVGGWIAEMPKIGNWRAGISDTLLVRSAGANGDSTFVPYSLRDTNVVFTSSIRGELDAVNLADKKFLHTNIATAEFRSRLPFIKQACDSRIMHCYSDNPNRALWKSDLAAADTMEKSGCAMAGLFRQFAKQKDGRVDAKDPNTTAVLDKMRSEAIEKYSKRVQAQQAEFKSYSFGMKQLGWANIDRLSDGNRKMFFNAHVDGVAPGEKLTVSLMIPGRGIFLPGYRRPNGDYSFTHGENEQEANYPQGEVAYIVAKSGVGADFRYALKPIHLGTNPIESLAMKKGSEAELARELGNAPPEKQPEEAPVIDDWYTKSLQFGNGCLCNSETGFRFGSWAQ